MSPQDHVLLTIAEVKKESQGRRPVTHKQVLAHLRAKTESTLRATTSDRLMGYFQSLQGKRLIKLIHVPGDDENPYAVVELLGDGMERIDMLLAGIDPADDPRKVFVVHGRNGYLKDAMFQYLLALRLNPLEWLHLFDEPSPHIDEVLDNAFSQAQAVIVMLTPDDEGRLRDQFHKEDEDHHEVTLTPQARQNVLFEAGMAFGRKPKRTILVQIGKVRHFSDIAGRHIVHFDGSSAKRNELASKLKLAGCPVDTRGDQWLSAGDFTLVP